MELCKFEVGVENQIQIRCCGVMELYCLSNSKHRINSDNISTVGKNNIQSSTWPEKQK